MEDSNEATEKLVVCNNLHQQLSLCLAPSHQHGGSSGRVLEVLLCVLVEACDGSFVATELGQHILKMVVFKEDPGTVRNETTPTG